MPDLAVVGAGIMGANHVRTARTLREWGQVTVVDPDVSKAQAVASANGFRATGDLEQALAEVDAVIVAVPSDLHEQITLAALRMNRHVLVEKPLADNLESAARIARAAESSLGRVLVGHVERFNSAVGEIVDWAKEAVHLEFRRVGPKGPRVLGDVVSDLMIHDLEIFLALAQAHWSATGQDSPLEIRSLSAMWAGPDRDMCLALIQLSTGLTASFTASRIGQVKDRSVVLTGTDVQVVADLVRQSVSVYRIAHTEFVDSGGARYRQTGTTEIPYLDSGEPLAREQRHFAAVVQGDAEPIVGIDQAYAALELVERVRRSADGS